MAGHPDTAKKKNAKKCWHTRIKPMQFHTSYHDMNWPFNYGSHN
jgi:hypothetical protein